MHRGALFAASSVNWWCLVVAELRESLTRVGSDLKQKIIESVKSTWRTINDFANYRRVANDEAAADNGGEVDVDSIVADTSSYYGDTSGS